MDDLLAWPLLVDLAALMTVEIENAGLPPFCHVGIMPGAGVAWDYCTECGGESCGMAWVRLASIREEPDQTTGGYASCSSVFVVNVEMGMVRCHETLDSNGNPMTVQYQHDKAQAQMAEQAAMRRVLLGCNDTEETEIAEMNKLLGLYSPIGPAGGCVGGAWTCQFEMF